MLLSLDWRHHAKHKVGDPAFGWARDHVEPGKLYADTLKPFEHPNVSLQVYSCVGNKAKVISRAAKGAIGYVLGHHGGSEHVIVDFSRKVKEKLTYDTKIVIFAKGQGLRLLDYPDIMLYNLDPALLDVMKITKSGKQSCGFR